jgi:TniQ
MRLDAGNAGAAQPLPILVFDERRLTPSFGYVFKPQWLDPHESIVSILWKFAMMNGLSGNVVATQVAKTTIDPYDGIEPKRDAVDIRRLRAVLGLRLKQLRASLIPRSLERISSRYFRYCPKCLRRGYHGVLHQLEPLQLCPMHGCWLHTDCRHCHQPSPYRLNARLLDTPFRCSNCRLFYAIGSPSFESRQALSCRALVALTRTRLRYAA